MSLYKPPGEGVFQIKGVCITASRAKLELDLPTSKLKQNPSLVCSLLSGFHLIPNVIKLMTKYNIQVAHQCVLQPSCGLRCELSTVLATMPLSRCHGF